MPDIRELWDGSPARAAEHVRVTLAEVPGGLGVHIDAPFHGDPPPAGPVGPTWALWEHEVVELFVLGPDDRYTELEVGPHGHFLLLRLEGRRNIVEKLLPVDVTVTRTGPRWHADVLLANAILPPRPWRINATAIHGAAGIGSAGRRYLSLFPLPGTDPDFHRIELFREMDGIGQLLPG